ncbi:hypothetical protein FHG87_002573 [Trinorchestia longiramus]|nr:hypothetical protein FHG87_002573 [Trinorchestia longiramus]
MIRERRFWSRRRWYLCSCLSIDSLWRRCECVVNTHCGPMHRWHEADNLLSSSPSFMKSNSTATGVYRHATAGMLLVTVREIRRCRATYINSEGLE